MVEKLQTSMQSGQVDLRRLDHRFRPDRHALPLRRRSCRCPTTWPARARSSPTRASTCKDFIGTKFTTAPDGKLYQLPDQQFANLYWFRADRFARKDLQDKFKQVRLRPGRAAQLERLRGHRRVLHQRREGDRRQARSTATWTTARRTRRSAGASPTPGCRWPAPPTRASRTACRSTSGASASRPTSARRSAHRCRAAAPPTRRPRSTRSPSTSTG